MMNRIAAMALLTLALSVSEAPAAQTAEGCRAAKIKAAANAGAQKLKCYAAAAKKGVAVDPACLADVDTKFGVVVVRIESRGSCSPTGDAATYLGKVDSFVSDVVGLGLCPAKTKAAGVDAKGELKCYAKAIKKGEDADQSCLDKADAKLLKSFDKADADGCLPAGGATTVQAQVEAFVGQVVGTTRITLFEYPTQAPGSLGNRATTTAACAAAASSLSLTCTTTVAMLSYTGDAVREFPTNYGLPTGVPIVANGQTIANNWADFLDGTWDTCLGSTCSPAGPVGAGFVSDPTIWTGTKSDGTVAENCNDWTSSSSGVSGARPWYIGCYGVVHGGGFPACIDGDTFSRVGTATPCAQYYAFGCFCF